MTKKLSVQRGNFSNYFMKIIVFSQMYRSKLTTLEIAHDMKNRFLVMYYIFHPQKNKVQKQFIPTFEYNLI